MNLPTPLKARLPESWRERFALLLETLQHWPWLETLRTLRLRFREDHLGLTASSLTFTTLISLVPLVTVTLAIFSAFPMFSSFQEALQKYFLQSLVPDNIAKPVLQALTQFASKANRLGTVGLRVRVLRRRDRAARALVEDLPAFLAREVEEFRCVALQHEHGPAGKELVVVQIGSREAAVGNEVVLSRPGAETSVTDGVGHGWLRSRPSSVVIRPFLMSS